MSASSGGKDSAGGLREVDADEAERAHLLDQLGLDAGLRLTSN